MPSQEEQKEVVWYVLERPLVRPNTSCKKAALCVLFFLLANCGATILLYYMLQWLGVSTFLPKVIDAFFMKHHEASIILLAVIQFTIGGLVALKPAIIGVVRLYQHYAPERIRRKCLFKPTCSEYMILAIEKYGVVRGLRKSYIRLFKKCRGNIYRIDEP